MRTSVCPTGRISMAGSCSSPTRKSGGPSGHLVGDDQHLAAHRLQLYRGGKQSGRDSLDHTPFPDRLRIEAGASCEPMRAVTVVDADQLFGILTHQDAHVVLRLSTQAV